MKKSIFFILLVAVVSVFNSCTTPPIEAAQEAYDYDAIIPAVIGGVSGPAIAIQTFTADYTIGYYRGGSTWNWSATDATVLSVSDDTRTATIQFSNYPDDGTATVTVTETTMGGITSDAASKEVTVQKYCALENGVSDMVGSWSGTDAYYESIITMAVSGTDLAVTGISVGFIQDWWAETVTAGGTVTMIVNEDGTVEIERQYIYTTDYEGDPYRYEIEGEGTWDNCGDSPSMIIDYDIYYEGDEAGLAETYSSYLGGIPYLTATIELDNSSKSAEVVALTKLQRPEFKNK